MHHVKLVGSLALTALLVASAVIVHSAHAAPPVSLTLVSGPSPYASCTAGTSGGGTNFVDAEVEPLVSVNPTHTNNILGAFQQDRWSNGGAHGLVAGFSVNGGQSWSETTLPFSVCAPGGLNYDRASDPWVSFGPDGTAYTVAISVTFLTTAFFPNNNAVAAAISTNGGQTWGNLTVIQADSGSTFFNDKESVTADPVHAGVAYLVWDRLQSPNANPDSGNRAFAFTGPTMFSKTTNGGQSWSTPRIIVNTAQNNQTIGNQVVVDPRTDTLYDFFDLIVSTGPNDNDQHNFNVAVIKSTDGGATWSSPLIVATLQAIPVTDPNTGARIRTGDIIPEPAIDPASGQLYVVWQDTRFTSQFDEVALSTSTDGGATWSAPIQVNTNTPANRPAFTPTVSVNSAGTVGVTFYDFRSLTTQTTTLPTDYWFVTSTTHGASFDSEVHLAGPFDMLTAPLTGAGFFVGDYEGLATVGTSFQPFFVQANSGNTSNRTDVFTTSVGS